MPNDLGGGVCEHGHTKYVEKDSEYFVYRPEKTLPDDLRRGMASKYIRWRAWPECNAAHERRHEHAGRDKVRGKPTSKYAHLELNLCD